MNKKLILALLIIIVVLTSAGCSSANTMKKPSDIDKNVENLNDNNTILSCSKEFYLFHSKQHIENIVSFDKNNKLVKYEAVEKYYSFDSNDEYIRTCEGITDEASGSFNNNEYLKTEAKCNENSQEVIISYQYDISKLSSKNLLPKKEIKDYLNDNYILDLEQYKANLINKDYSCE